MNIMICSDYKDMSHAVAEFTAEYIKNNPDTLICLSAGTTAQGMYSELVKMQDRHLVDLNTVYYAQLDEWIGLGKDDKGSSSEILFDNYFIPANIDKNRVHTFNGLSDDLQNECKIMERWIRSKGGLGLAVLGIGTNGHIGLNEPNAPTTQEEGCFIVGLENATKDAGKRLFDRQYNIEYGFTIGSKTLLNAKKLAIIAEGEKKAQIIKSAFRDDKTEQVQASLLRDHDDLSLIIDVKAAEYL